MQPGFQRDLTRTTLAVLFIGGLLLFTFWIVGPFLPAVVWSSTLVVATCCGCRHICSAGAARLWW